MIALPLVMIRGGGDLGTGVALRLWRARFPVVIAETAAPTLIRRTVAFGTAVFVGECTVEGIAARRAASAEEVVRMIASGEVPVLVDPDARSRDALRPAAIVDAILGKGRPATRRDDAPVVVGLGPGMTAGSDEDGADVHAVVETLRGHRLGRVIYRGRAADDTGVPGEVGGASSARVLRAPADGSLAATRQIGDRVAAGDAVGSIVGVPVVAGVAGVIRGLLWPGVPATRGMKVGDIDPRGDASVVGEVSDKALAVGGGALEAILHFRERWDSRST